MPAKNDAESLHIVVFPWLAFGHIFPYFELSKHLARRGHRISFVSAPRNIQRLPKVPPEIAHLVDLIAIELPPTEGLPKGKEATRDVSPAEDPFLKKALDGMEPAFAEFIKAAAPKPDWIIQDFAQHWVPAVAAANDVPTIELSIITASNLVFHGTAKVAEKHGCRRVRPEHYTEVPPWIPSPSTLRFRPWEARKLFRDFGSTHGASGVSERERGETVFRACKALAIRSCVEAEPKYLPLLQEIYGDDKPVIPVGVLQPPMPDDSDGDAGIIEWLTGRSPKSVVYVAFGSEATISDELMLELAHGLELAGLPFLWALRRPAGMADDAGILPAGFEERTRGYGLVCSGWVPQLKILAHEAMGGFLTHSGWSSAIESLQYGHPLVLLPIFGDQWVNARVMSETGYGLEIERDPEDGTFTRDAVAKGLRLVMVEAGGESYRKKAEELRHVFADGEVQARCVDGLVRFMLENRTGAKKLEREA